VIEATVALVVAEFSIKTIAFRVPENDKKDGGPNQGRNVREGETIQMSSKSVEGVLMLMAVQTAPAAGQAKKRHSRYSMGALQHGHEAVSSIYFQCSFSRVWRWPGTNSQSNIFTLVGTCVSQICIAQSTWKCAKSVWCRHSWWRTAHLRSSLALSSGNGSATCSCSNTERQMQALDAQLRLVCSADRVRPHSTTRQTQKLFVWCSGSRGQGIWW
jgi:hypothetical protein